MDELTPSGRLFDRIMHCAKLCKDCLTEQCIQDCLKQGPEPDPQPLNVGTVPGLQMQQPTNKR